MLPSLHDRTASVTLVALCFTSVLAIALTAVHSAPGDYPGGKAGDVLVVQFTVLGWSIASWAALTWKLCWAAASAP